MLLYFSLQTGDIYINYLLRFGERGEVVNTSGCEPDIREFDSHRSPQTLKTVKMVVIKTAIFLFSAEKRQKV